MSEFNPSISLFKNAKTNTPLPGVPSLSSILGFIQCGTYKKEVEAIRASQLKAERDELKKKLQAVTWSGVFSKRNAESLEQYSFILCHDIDKLQDHVLKNLKKQLCEDPYVYSCFISPSGNGLKLLFRVDELMEPMEDNTHHYWIPEVHQKVWQATAKYLDDTYGALVDPSTKDICRLCFASYDPELYLNQEAATIDHGFIEKHSQLIGGLPQEQAPPPPRREPDNNSELNEHQWIIHKINDIVRETVTPGDGTYNKYINLYAIQANRYGLTTDECADAIAVFCGWAAPDKDDIAVVKSVYSKFPNEHGKYLKDGKPIIPKERKLLAPAKQKAPAAAAVSEPDKYDVTTTFWYEIETVSDKGSKKLEIKYSYDDAAIFLRNNGFFKYRLDKKYQLLYVDQYRQICDVIDEDYVRDFVLDFLREESIEGIEYKKIREMMRRGMKNYINTTQLGGLEYYKPTLKKDTKTTCFVYFRNCYLEITKENIKMHGYEDQQGFVWKKQVKDFDFTPSEGEVSEFQRYIWYAITGRKLQSGEEYTPVEEQKLNSVYSSIGYLLHQFKDPTVAKAVISVDKLKRNTGEANGRTGKSLLGKGMGYMVNVCTLDCRKLKFDTPFALQQVEIDTQIINFNDLPKNFLFDYLYGPITEDLTYEKKKLDSITIPFNESPKIYGSTNFSLKGEGESYKDRQHIIEFSNYFNSKYKPINEFGKNFFSEWDENEWNCFYNFMVWCIQQFLQHGLREFPVENYGLNKLLDTANEEFVDYMDYLVLELNPIGTRLEVKKIFTEFLEKNKTYEKWLKQNTFTKWVKMWVVVRELEINAHKPDGRDRSDGTDYWTFTKLNPDPLTDNPDAIAAEEFEPF